MKFKEMAMGKFSLLVSCLFFATSAMAGSNIVGTWVNNGDTLSIQIVDDPANAPFTAGEVWAAMKASGSAKSIKSPNFDLKCSGLTDESGKSSGNCKIRIPKSLINWESTQMNFAISKEEAAMVLNEFNQPSNTDTILVKSGSFDQNGREKFMFEANWRYKMVAFVISNSLVSE